MMTTNEPNPPRGPQPGPGWDQRLHWIVTGLIVFGCMAYVLHQHPALRETAAAVGGLGMLALAAVQGARRR